MLERGIVGDGSLIQVNIHNIPMHIAGKILNVRIGFSKTIGIGFNIIGRKDVFENFVITFNEKERYIDFV